MNYRDAYKTLKRRFPSREANVCHESEDGKYVFCFLPVASELDENGMAIDLSCYSVDKFTGEIEPLFFQDIVGKFDDALRYVFNESDVL